MIRRSVLRVGLLRPALEVRRCLQQTESRLPQKHKMVTWQYCGRCFPAKVNPSPNPHRSAVYPSLCMGEAAHRPSSLLLLDESDYARAHERPCLELLCQVNRILPLFICSHQHCVGTQWKIRQAIRSPVHAGPGQYDEVMDTDTVDLFATGHSWKHEFSRLVVLVSRPRYRLAR